MSIDSFSKQYRFLSNFQFSVIEYDGMFYNSVEHAYQASKTLDRHIRTEISELNSPGKAKTAGRSLTLRDDWDNIKDEIMLGLLRDKFAIPELRTKLLDTGEEELIEGNDWGDTYWGVCGGVGKNKLGKLLMQVRSEIERRNNG